ncbi:hypothetical protein WN944_025803 [Citrus x changshan-huyou]|uniref:Uncharacterized protein n=1 Tax=Citrus x changshan-huyou TaxID=2935761 RepID=A0AAP0LR84_9ROSI
MSVFSELDAAKQELWKNCQGCDATFEAKVNPFNPAAAAAAAENSAKANMEQAIGPELTWNL